MLTIEAIAAFLEQFAPPSLAAEWDNVGLLVGDLRRPVQRVMTCLSVTPTSVAEAIELRADLIVTHHPLPFRPFKRITAETNEGRMLLELIAARIAVYSPHTAFDSARLGINQRLAEGLGLVSVVPLVAAADEPQLGAGRFGRFEKSLTLDDLASRVQRFLGVAGVQIVGESNRPINIVAVACGSAGELLPAACQAGCDALVLGETNFHTALAAEASGVALIMAGHFASERFAVEDLAAVLTEQFAGLEVWRSRDERDPLRWFTV